MNNSKLTDDSTTADAMTNPQPAQAFSSPPFHFIGLGGAGCNAMETIHTKGIAAHFTGISDPTRPALPPGVHFIPYTPEVKKDALAADYLLDDAFAVSLSADMLAILSQPNHFVLLTGLGGYTGTRLLQAFTRQLQHQQYPFTIIATLPFHWEKERKKAVEALLPAYRSLPQFHTIDLNLLLAENRNKQMNMKTFMQLANEMFYELFLHLDISKT